jgi:hypothetical protein
MPAEMGKTKKKRKIQSRVFLFFLKSDMETLSKMVAMIFALESHRDGRLITNRITFFPNIFRTFGTFLRKEIFLEDET